MSRPLTKKLIDLVEEKAAREGAAYHRPGSRKCRIRIMYDDHGDEAAAAFAEKLGLKQSTYKAWRSDWKTEAAGGLPPWRERMLEARQQRATRPLHSAPASFDAPDRAEIEVGPAGRIVIPAAMRKKLGMEEGSKIVLLLKGDELSLLTPEAGLRRAQALVKKYSKSGRSMVDELLEDRRREAAEEERS